MSARRLALLLLALAAGAAVLLWLGRREGELHYTGFVEGEERVLRSEVSGRVLEVLFAEGDELPAGAVVARLDASENEARMRSKQQERSVLEAEIARQEQQVVLAEATWREDVAARQAERRQAEAEAELAARSHERQRRLHESGVASPQRLDEARAARDVTRGAVERSRDLLARALAEEGQVGVARHGLAVLRERLGLAGAELAELELQRARHQIRAPATPTRVQAQLTWPGELAQPGTPVLSVLDPRDSYVQIYVPVPDAARVRVGRRVELELDSAPGRRVPGEVVFVADEASFTPEKIETRSDRLGQVYRAKVRILEEVERLQPGTEGDVYLVEDGAEAELAAPAGGGPR